MAGRSGTVAEEFGPEVVDDAELWCPCRRVGAAEFVHGRDLPDWYRILVAEPAIELTIDGDTQLFIARVTSDEEKAEMSPRIVAAHKGYADDQSKTDRNNPVVVCGPRSA